MFTLKNHYDCLFSISLIEGKQNNLDYVFCCCYVVIAEINYEIEILMTLEPRNSSRKEDTEMLKTTNQIAIKMILTPLPESYGINFGNHISPGKYNSGGFLCP